MDDNSIVALYWNREEEAITETANKYGRYCFAIALNILSNTEDAEESVNDAYMNAWNSMPPHRPVILSAFLGKITRFICLKKWRDTHTQKRGEGELPLVYEELSECLASAQGVEEELETKELAQIIRAFLGELPVSERRVFICRYWYVDSIAAISKQFHFSESKVKSMLYRTRAKLRSVLIKEGVYLDNR